MGEFDIFLGEIENADHRAKAKEMLEWVKSEFPTLEPVVKWHQQMFTDHGTFIIAFSAYKNHLSISPERAGILHFEDVLNEKGIDYTKMLVRFFWNAPIDYDILKQMIAFNILDKAECTAFWRA